MRRLKDFAVDYLRSVSQVFFFNDARFGFLLISLVAIFSPFAFACAFGASLIGYNYGIRYSTPRALTGSGLLVINGFFYGLALAYLFEPSPQFWTLLLIGACVLPPVTKASFEVLQHWRLSPLVLPYIACVWMVWLCRRQVALIENRTDGFVDLEALTRLGLNGDLMDVLSAPLVSMGRLLFFPNAWFGLALLGLVSLFSIRRGGYFVLGTMVAVLVSRGLSAEAVTWQGGSLAFSAGLVALGLAAMPEKFSLKTMLFYSGLSTLLTMASMELFHHLHLQVLSFPFLITLWLATLSRVPRMNVTWAPKNMQRTPLIGDYERAV